MNFCFWPGNPAGNFEYEHMTKALARILEKDPSWFLPENLSKNVAADFLKREVFNLGSEDKVFALLEERARIVSEVGTLISHSYNGSFLKFLECA